MLGLRISQKIDVESVGNSKLRTIARYKSETETEKARLSCTALNNLSQRSPEGVERLIVLTFDTIAATRLTFLLSVQLLRGVMSP